jgi:hypothetical protein
MNNVRNDARFRNSSLKSSVLLLLLLVVPPPSYRT